MKSHFVVLAVAAAALASGCSTIINGKAQDVTINSNVRDAEITINGKVVGRTPFTGLIERAQSATVTLKKDGYVSKSITMDTSIEPWFWGNIIVGGVLGSTTDASTGDMYKYAPATLEIDLEAAPAGK